MPQTSKASEEATLAVHETVAKLQQMGFAAMPWMGTEYAERMADLGSEVLDFLAERVHEDVQFQHKLLHCRDMTELHRLQAEFIQRMINRYTEETGKMVELSSRAWLMPFQKL